MKRFNSNRLSIENLERREMMAADAVLANGVLNITGTEQADRIIVSQATTRSGLMTVRYRSKTSPAATVAYPVVHERPGQQH